MGKRHGRLAGDQVFYVAKCVWGDDYIDTMLDYNLPSLLAPGNLPALARRYPTRHRIYTFGCHEDRIRAHPAYQAVAAAVESDIVALAWNPEELAYQRRRRGAKHRTMNTIHQRILRDLERDRAIWFYDAPDQFWADGNMDWLCDKMAQGYACVVLTGMRIDRRRLAERLPAYADPATGALVLSRAELTRQMLDIGHELEIRKTVGMGFGDNWPHMLLWPVADKACLMRSYHAQPIAVFPRHYHLGAEATMDLDYIEKHFDTRKEIYYQRDSDEFALVDMSAPQHALTHPIATNSLASIAAWGTELIGWQNFENFRHPIRLHAGPVAETAWRRAERLSHHHGNAIFKLRSAAIYWQTRLTERRWLPLILRRVMEDVSLLRHLPVGLRYTLIAPSEAAIEGYLDSHPDLLRPQNPAPLLALLRDHLIAASLDTAALQPGPLPPTLSGRRYRLEKHAAGWTLAGLAAQPDPASHAGLRVIDIDGLLCDGDVYRPAASFASN